MAIPTGTPTTTSSISNLVQAAYDQYVRMALRSIPVMRSLADVKPVQQAMPGSSVVFSIYSDLAQATSTLTETSDVSSIALGNPSQVTVTLNEYGSAVTTTKKLNLTSFNDVDSALADIIAYNAADSIDNVVGQVLSAGTNVIYSNGPSGTVPTASSGILPVDTMTVADIRNAVVSLRTNKALPRMGELYAAYLHPRQSADLRAETGTGGFQELTKYVERTPFVAGAVGVIEGAFIVETPRVLNGLKLSTGITPTTTITNVALTSNVVTITTAVAHGLGTGQVVTVAATTNTAVNGTFTITGTTSTTFTYALTASNITSVADTGTVTFTNNYRAIVAGREALAEAQAADISTVIGPEIDALRRFRTIGWYYFGGFARQWQTWGTDYNEFTPYSRLAGRRFNGGTIDGAIAPSMTDIPRGQTLIVNGTTVTATLTPSQDDLAAASYYFLGGHEYEISDYQAGVLTAAGYGSWITPV
jgi:N4-gp56 family major capsid protein